MRALERLKAAVSMAPIEYSVSLPNGELFTYYASPLTLAERRRVEKESRQGDNLDFAVRVLAFKAMDENGQKMFGPADVAALRNELPENLVSKMCLNILGEDEEEEEIDMKRADEESEGGQAAAGRARSSK